MPSERKNDVDQQSEIDSDGRAETDRAFHLQEERESAWSAEGRVTRHHGLTISGSSQVTEHPDGRPKTV